MADNYLEKRMEELRTGSSQSVVKRGKLTLKQLLQRSRGCRPFDPKVVVRESHLRDIADVGSVLSEPFSETMFLFTFVTKAGVGRVLPYTDIETKQFEPQSFILISSNGDSSYSKMALGALVQSMLLRATEMGLGGAYVELTDPYGLSVEFSISSPVVAILAVGKGIK